MFEVSEVALNDPVELKSLAGLEEDVERGMSF